MPVESQAKVPGFKCYFLVVFIMNQLQHLNTFSLLPRFQMVISQLILEHPAACGINVPVI
jgi:hypothetical protein